MTNQMKINTYVVKVASRCNLNCSYCHIYNMGDETYTEQPKFMSIKTFGNFVKRLKKYCHDAEISEISIAYHGGEPMLISKEFYREADEMLTKELVGIKVNQTIQTNGTLLDNEWCSLFKELKFSVGISIDGNKLNHDKYRTYHNGKGSYEDIKQAIALALSMNLPLGTLTVVNLDMKPSEFYDTIKTLGIESANILLPDAHYHNLDAFDKNLFGQENYHPYADWLIELYEIWKQDKTRIHIRFLELFIGLIMGRNDVGNQLVGTLYNSTLIIESNGGMEAGDALRGCDNGFTRNSLNVSRNEISEIAQLDLYKTYYYAHELMCEQCLNCPVKEICGNGFLPHRYSKENGFNNPTVYCKDFIKFICHIQNDIMNQLDEKTIQLLGLFPISYQEIIGELKDANYTEKINPDIELLLTSFNQNVAKLN